MLKTHDNTLEIRSACLWLGPNCKAGHDILETIHRSDPHRTLRLRIYGSVNRGTASVVSMAYKEAAAAGQPIVCEVGTERVKDTLLALAVPDDKAHTVQVVTSRPGSGGYVTLTA